MIETHFEPRDIIFLSAGFLLVAAAIVLFAGGRPRIALWILLLGGLSFRLMMAFIDPFLHIWDEQYHALVAKNLTENYIHPILVADPMMPVDPTYWAYTHTWLHKPPLFLWQMAVCIELFGVHEWAIRIPSVLLSTLMIPAIYRMGKLVANERAGFLAALLAVCSNILINVVSGYVNTDHNDVVFSAYVCFSFWAWIEYMYAPKKRWIILTGLFAACAVLTKWLPGMMVFGAWGITLLLDKEARSKFTSWLHLALSFFFAVAVAAPWFIYVAIRWPIQWSAAMNNYSGHFSDSMTHEGSWWYHFGELVEQNGWMFTIVFLISVVFFLRDPPKRALRTGIFATVMIVYTFYTFVSARMPLFCLSVLPLIIIVVGYGMDKLIDLVADRFRKTVFTIVALLFAFLFVNVGRIEHYHTVRDPKSIYRPTRINNRNEFLYTLRDVPSNALVYNCGQWNAVTCMFYVDCTAYDDPPTAEEIAEAQRNDRPLFVFNDGELPEHVLTNPDVTIIDADLIRNGF